MNLFVILLFYVKVMRIRLNINVFGIHVRELSGVSIVQVLNIPNLTRITIWIACLINFSLNVSNNKKMQ